jgi:hypothetical protein
VLERRAGLQRHDGVPERLVLRDRLLRRDHSLIFLATGSRQAAKHGARACASAIWPRDELGSILGS